MQQPTQFEYKKYLQLIVRRKEIFVAVALLIMTSVIIVSYLLPKKYEASSTVFIEKNVISELVKGITVTPSMEDTIKVLTYAITSRTLLTKVAENLDMNLSKGSNVESIIQKLQANTSVKVKDNNLFIISYTDQDPKLARDYVNTLVRLYIEDNSSSKRGESYDATQFLSEQIDNFQNKLEKAEDDVSAYRRDKGGVIAVDEGKLFEDINLSRQKLYDLELQRNQLEARRQNARTTSDPLLSKITAMQKRLDELRVEYTDKYPEIVKIKNDIETAKEQMKTRSSDFRGADPQEMGKINTEIAAIKLSENSLRRYIATNESLLKQLPSAKAGLEKLELEKTNQKNIYDQLYTRHSQSEVSKQMEVQDKSTTFRIVDPAVQPAKPASPNRLNIMLMGIIGGLAGSFGILMLLDQMNSSVRDVDFIKGLGLPLLAVVPRIHDQQQVDLHRRRTVRLFSAAGVYMLFLLCFPLMEVLGMTYVDRLLGMVLK